MKSIYSSSGFWITWAGVLLASTSLVSATLRFIDFGISTVVVDVVCTYREALSPVYDFASRLGSWLVLPAYIDIFILYGVFLTISIRTIYQTFLWHRFSEWKRDRPWKYRLELFFLLTSAVSLWPIWSFYPFRALASFTSDHFRARRLLSRGNYQYRDDAESYVRTTGVLALYFLDTCVKILTPPFVLAGFLVHATYSDPENVMTIRDGCPITGIDDDTSMVHSSLSASSKAPIWSW